MMNQSATVLTINQTRAAEQAAVDAGSSFWQLMETAGTAAAQDLLKRPVNYNAIGFCVAKAIMAVMAW